MKPLYLEMQAFGPFVEKQIVDFEKLSVNGLFLIKGETGSGKTTIFDAMTFALYGGGSGTDEKSKVGRNDFEEWRCNQAPDRLETIISFTFSSHNKKYIFTRKLVMKTKNLHQIYEAGEIDNEGNIIPFFNNPKAADLKEKAEEIIGLTKEQFRQVVLLPQGQFERFLTASADEKTEILNKIFNTDIWQRYAQKLFESADAKDKFLKNEKLEVDNSLAEEKLTDIDELSEKIYGLKLELGECERQHQEFVDTKKQEKLNEDIRLSEQFKPLHELQNEKNELEQQSDEIKEKEQKYDAAEKAEKIRPLIDKFEKAESEFKVRIAELKKNENSKPSVKEAANEAKKAAEKHEKDSPVAELNAKIGEYESKRENYESFGELEKGYREANSAYLTAKKEFDEANEKFTDSQKTASDLLKAYNIANETAKNYRTKYYAGIYGEIADSLIDNEKCPVCGSTEHPCPAQKSSDSVSKSDMEAKENGAADAKNSWDDAENKRKDAEGVKNSKESVFKEKETSKEKAKAEWEAAKNSLIDGIEDIKSLENAIANLSENINSYKEKGKELQKARQKAESALVDIEAQIKTATQEKLKAEGNFNAAQSELNKALENGGYSDVESVKSLLLETEERTQLHKEITAYKTKCEGNKKNLIAKKTELSGKIEPDCSKFEERQKEITDESEKFSKTGSKLSQEIKRLTQKYNDLSKKLEHFNREKKIAENDVAFARKLRGDTGIGIQRYVLAIMFNQVIGEANEMLKKIHGGRYTLFRSNDKGEGNKRGLELKVHDSRSPEKEGRSVSMLSGGEKFLVSLALSIGMSTVAQKSGVQIEALFIDEGFGTLDKKSIDDAMEILESVRKSSGTIGIISHVELLEETIQPQLEVIKSENGNRIKTV